MKKIFLRMISVALTSATMASAILSAQVFAYGEQKSNIIVEKQQSENTPPMKNEDNNQTNRNSVENNAGDMTAEDDAPGGVVGSVHETSDDMKENEETFIYTCKGDGVTVTAETKPENGIPESAVLHADKLAEGSEEYNDAIEKARDGLGLKEDEPLYYVPYDIYFTDGGKKIEPKAGKVNVRMEFEEEPFENIDSDENETTAMDKSVIHIQENGVIEKINPKTFSNTDIEFEVNQFSVMGIAAANYVPYSERNDGIVHIIHKPDYYFSEDETPCEIYLNFYVKESGSYKKFQVPVTQSDYPEVMFGDDVTRYTGWSCLQNFGMDMRLAVKNFSHMTDSNEMHIKLPTKHNGSDVYVSLTDVASPKYGGGTTTLGPYPYNPGWSSGPYIYFDISHSSTSTPVPTTSPSRPIPSPTPVPSSLQIGKQVTGSGADLNKQFTFDITLTGNIQATNFNRTLDITSEGGVMYTDSSTINFTNGKASIKLKHGQAIKIKGLPIGSTYTVTEREANQDGYGTNDLNGTGTLVANNTSEVMFYNFKEEDTGSLKLSKTVSGSGGDLNKDWHFTITLSGDKGDNFNKECEVSPENGASPDKVSFTNGTATVALKHGQSITIQGLPAGVNYTVSETEADTDGYTTTKSGATGQITKGETKEVSFTNSKSSSANLPSTGGPGTRNLIFISILLFAIGSLTAKIVCSDKQRKTY